MMGTLATDISATEISKVDISAITIKCGLGCVPA